MDGDGGGVENKLVCYTGNEQDDEMKVVTKSTLWTVKDDKSRPLNTTTLPYQRMWEIFDPTAHPKFCPSAAEEKA